MGNELKDRIVTNDVFLNIPLGKNGNDALNKLKELRHNVGNSWWDIIALQYLAGVFASDSNPSYVISDRETANEIYEKLAAASQHLESAFKLIEDIQNIAGQLLNKEK